MPGSCTLCLCRGEAPCQLLGGPRPIGGEEQLLRVLMGRTACFIQLLFSLFPEQKVTFLESLTVAQRLFQGASFLSVHDHVDAPLASSQRGT